MIASIRHTLHTVPTLHRTFKKMETFLYLHQIVGIVCSVAFGLLWFYGMIKKIKDNPND